MGGPGEPAQQAASDGGGALVALAAQPAREPRGETARITATTGFERISRDPRWDAPLIGSRSGDAKDPSRVRAAGRPRAP
jgi:hypothetical protein